MSGREVRHVHGVGINSQFHVMEDGRQIGWIGRKGNLGFQVEALYDRVLFRRLKLSQARDDALAAEFPTEAQAWQAHWDETFAKRKRVLQRTHGSQIAELASAMLDGSNSARSDLTDLLADIEREAADPNMRAGRSGEYLPNFRRRRDAEGVS